MPGHSLRGKNERLLHAMAEEIKLPLLQVARQAELAQQDPSTHLLQDIETAASQALWFIDSYLLSQQLRSQVELQLEPVAVSAVLQDAAYRLDKLAKQYDCELELRLSGKYAPVMAHAEALEAALVGVGTTLIMAADHKSRQVFTLAAHKSHGGIVAGVFGEQEELSRIAFRQGKSLYGRARQPLSDLTAQNGAGIFIADSLFSSMATHLRVARHHKLTGLAATLHQSRQLSLV